jgi:hypothetical protein
VSKQSQLDEAVNFALALPHGPAKLALLEEAARLADSIQNVQYGYEIRNEIMETATFSGRDDLLLVAFTWNLAQFDKDPEEFDEFDLLWKYKWVIGNVTNFPEVNRKQVFAMLDDIERRYKTFGSTLQVIWSLRRDVLLDFGLPDEADAANEKYRKLGRDPLSDCAACSAGSECDFHVMRGRWKKAVTSVNDVLAKNMTCAEEPHRTYSRVLYPLLKTGELDRARDYQARGAKLIAKEGMEFLRAHGRQLEFLALTDDIPRAKRVLERRFNDAIGSVDVNSRMRFYRAAWIFCECLKADGATRIKIQLPDHETLPAVDDKGNRDTGALADWFRDESLALAKRFDKRNGNTWFSDYINEAPGVVKWAKSQTW